MYAMILAAGRGERMRPLTDTTPKPLLSVGGKPLIEHLLPRLSASGITRIVINHAHLGEQLPATLGDGSRFGVHIDYSAEPDGGLETGGGIINALPLLKSDPFIVINGDIWCDYPLSNLPHSFPGLAHLVLVDNPAHHLCGDFAIIDSQLTTDAEPRYTFSGIGVYRHRFFADCTQSHLPLAPLIRKHAASANVSAEHYAGEEWIDIGTPQRLKSLDSRLCRGARNNV
ncbi:MAG: nucleotidyltransferase family protein [Gammaproteobacteria bacterium]|nr:nucleotidyltransferase family protein [Gammaproteobacteria bacterium]